MSVLLVGADAELGTAVIARLLGAGDEVRAVESDPAVAVEWKSMGVHIAHGPPNADLIERAGQDCRTIVLFATGMPEGSIEAVLAGAAAAAIERVVVCFQGQEPPALAALAGFRGQYVALLLGRAGRIFGRRRAVAPSDVARAIDAADDLGGEVRLELDLTDPRAWSVLGLNAP